MKFRQRRYSTFNRGFTMLVVMGDLNQNPLPDRGGNVGRFSAITDRPFSRDQAAL
nr:MAG TPA: Endonuclease/Exonuclease/phosphatase family protein [Caudoviricetes sp.]